jgi:LPS sulfotransferase NodH
MRSYLHHRIRRAMAATARRSCLICTTPRTGSWLLGEALAATGYCREPQEYFRPDWMRLFARTGHLDPGHHLDFRSDGVGDGWRYPEAASFQLESFLAAIGEVGSSTNGIFSAKLHWHQFEQITRMARARGLAGRPDEATLQAWFPDPLYILLTRRDKIRQAVSYYRAIRTDIWHVPAPDGDVRESAGPPDLTEGGSDLHASEVDHAQVEQLRKLLVHGEAQWGQTLGPAGRRVLRLCYEDVAEDLPAAVETVLAALEPNARPARRQTFAQRLHRQADEVSETVVSDHQRWSVAAHGAFHKAAAPASQRVQTVVVEDFYADPQGVLEYALHQPYYYPYEDERDVRSGKATPTWMTSCFQDAKTCPFKSSDAVIAALEGATGEEIDRAYWEADFPRRPNGQPRDDHRSFLARSCLWNCSFHCKPENGQQEGEGVHNHVIDSWNGVDVDGWAGIVYLSPNAPLTGGLRLWRNRDVTRQLDWMTGRRNWELVDSYGNVPNRLILTRGNVPHSGSRGWGDSLQSGRIFQTFFFKVVSRGRRNPVTIDLRET